jgi:hypothetical protein
MTDGRRNVVESNETDPELRLGFAVGDPRVSDAELGRLCELARSGTVETAPNQPYAVNRISEMHGLPAAVVEDPPGRYRLNPDITAFAEAVLERERGHRQDDRIRHALLAALASLSADQLRVIEELCAPPRPLESAIRGREIDDPESFVSAVNAAARGHGISDPIVEMSASTVRATTPPDHLVGAMLKRLSAEAEQLKLDELASFLTRLGPGETALLRHLAGFEIADAATLRRLDPAGDVINDQARGCGLAADDADADADADADSLPALVSRDDLGRWRLDAFTRLRLRDLWRPPGQ